MARRIWVCPVCDKQFLEEEAMKSHLGVKHREEWNPPKLIGDM